MASLPQGKHKPNPRLRAALSHGLSEHGVRPMNLDAKPGPRLLDMKWESVTIAEPDRSELTPMPASPLHPFAVDLWLADGREAEVAGFRYPTRMAVIRLTGGGLLIWSPVALTGPLRQAIDALGEVRGLVAPNTLHDLFLAEWRAAYPSAPLHAAPGFAARRNDLTPIAELGEAAPLEWAADIDLVVVHGNRITTEVVLFHRPSATVLFTDLIQQFPRDWFRGWRALVARLDLMSEPEPTVPRKFRMAFTDRSAARAALQRIQAWPSEKVVMAHGMPVEREGAAFIGRAFKWLTG